MSQQLMRQHNVGNILSNNDPNISFSLIENNKQLIPKPLTPPGSSSLLNDDSQLSYSKLPISLQKQVKQTISAIDLFEDEGEANNILPKRRKNIISIKNGLKVFTIRQNVKKFSRKLLERVRKLPRFSAQHYQVLNDKASDSSLVNTIKHIEDMVVKKPSPKLKKGKSIIPGAILFTKLYNQLETVINKLCLNKVKRDLKYCAYTISQKIPIIEPQSKFASVLSGITIILQSFYMIIIPIDIGYSQSLLTNQLLGINMMFQALMLCHILSRFTKQIYLITYLFLRATFVNGQLVLGREEIIKNYFFGQFSGDFLSLLALFMSSLQQYLKSSEYFNFVLLLFYIQVLRILENSDTYSRKSLTSSKYLQYITRFLSLLLRIIFVEHIFSCLFFFLSRTMKDNGFDSFIDHYYLDGEPWYTQYITAFYFSSTTMITVGYGDLVPQNNGERLLVVVFELLSSIQLSYSFNTIGNIIQEIKIESEKNTQKTLLINEYMENKNISTQLQLQIREHLNFFWQEQEAEIHLSKQYEIVNELPESLKSMLLKEANEKIIQECPLFKNFNFSPSLLRELYKIIQALNLVPESILENEKIKQNIIGPCIYYIDKGIVVVQALHPQTNNITIVDDLKEKDYFGFKEFILGTEPNIQYKSTKFSRILCIPLSSFMDILKDNQEDNEIFNDMKAQLVFAPRQILSKLPQKCYGCNDPTHILTDCSIIHYVPDIERVIKKHQFPHFQERKVQDESSEPIRQRARSAFSALFDLVMIQESVNNYDQENSKFLDALYEQHSDYSETSSDESERDGASTRIGKESDSQPGGPQSNKLVEIKEENENEHDNENENEDLRSNSPLNISRGKNEQSPNPTPSIRRKKVARKPPIPKQTNVQRKKTQPNQKDSRRRSKSIAIEQLIKQSLGLKHDHEKTKRIHYEMGIDNPVQIQDKKDEKLDKIYKNEKLYLAMIERNRFLYFTKMKHFLSKTELWHLDMLHIKLRVLLHPINTENFESGRGFSLYKPRDNLDQVLTSLQTKIIRVKSKQYFDVQIGEPLYPGGKVLQLLKYLRFPFIYQLKYLAGRINGARINSEGDFIDDEGNFERKKTQPISAIQQRQLKNENNFQNLFRQSNKIYPQI